MSLARDLMAEGADAVSAAVEATSTRLRPVLMTAPAMIIGMAPMALGVADGGEQNASLGRAVIGGLVLGTMGALILASIAVTALSGGRRAENKHDAQAESDVEAPDPQGSPA